MIGWEQILLPAALAAVLVFVASSLIHMALKWHNPDYRKLPDEDGVRAAIRKGAPAPGQYIIPHCLEGKDKASPEMTQKFIEGPIGVLYLRASGALKLGPFLGKWVLYTLLVGLLVGYLAKSTLPVGAPYLSVFRLVGVSTWLAYSWSGPADSIWKGKPWSVTFKDMVDGLVYGLLTAGCFAWLWPR